MATKTAADPATDQGDGQGAKPADDKTPTMADVRREIREEIEAALQPVKDLLQGKGGSAPAAPASSASESVGPGDLAQMVTDAVTKTLGERDRKTADDSHAAEHQRLAAVAETVPVDRPRRSRWLGAIYDK